MTRILVDILDRTDPRLGRNVSHDDRSWNYMAQPKQAKPKGVNTFWGSKFAPLNQGDIGSCTGNAVAQWLNTDYAHKTLVKTHHGRKMMESDALHIYALGTTLDNIPGSYPPDDTGCDGGAVCKASRRLGYLTGYQWIFSFTSLQAQLEKSPVIMGSLWTNTMFTPKNGLVKVGRLINSNIAGGHAYMGAGIDFTEEVFIFRNEWGDEDDWNGCKPGGYFAIGFKDYLKLLDAQGDVIVPQGVV